MAIFHVTTKPISRSSGRSSTASAAYRSGCEIVDERTGLTHNYSKRSGVLITAAFDKDLNVLDRNILWNLAEKSENRKDSRTAREWVLAIPSELIPKAENSNNEHHHHNALTDINKNNGAWVAFKFAQELAIRYNVGVDVAIHAPDIGGDSRNYHAHILTTTRELKNDDGHLSLGAKSILEQSNSKRKATNSGSTIDDIKELRELWATIANQALELNHISARIDHRSHKERELEIQPTIKIGWQATAMERRGITTDRGDINRSVVINNAEIKSLRSDINGNKHYARWKKEANDYIHRSVLNRTPMDLLGIRLITTVRDNESKIVKSLSANVVIGKLLYEALMHKRKNKDVSLQIEKPENNHLKGSKTAQNIQDFIFKKIKEFSDSDNDNGLKRVIIDYAKLSTRKFTTKYDIDCDPSDLKQIHDKRPIAEAKKPQQGALSHIEISIPSKANSYNPSIN